MVLSTALSWNPIFAFMRAWLNYMLIILVSILCHASAAFGVSATAHSSVKLAVVQAAAVKQHERSERYDQLDDTEVITAAYTQYNTLGPVLLLNYQGLKTTFYPAVHSIGSLGRRKTMIQPYYKLIIFPFHGFW